MYKHSKWLLAAILMLATVAPVFAWPLPPAVLTKEHVTGAAGACHEIRPGDVRLQWTAFIARNISTTNVDVACSPATDVSQNGTKEFGAVLSNSRAVNVAVTCTATMNTGGSGPRSVTRSVLIDPRGHQRIRWDTYDISMDTFGGQTGFVCTLPPGVAVQWVWTKSTEN